MYKVIKIEAENVFVGKEADGEFTAIPKSSFGFEPMVGDYVEFYKNDSEYIVSKVSAISHFTGGVPSGKSSKSKTTAGVLALLLGAWGGYEFYTGKAGVGILRVIITLVGLIPFLLPIVIFINVVWNLVTGISVLTSKVGSKWHQDAQGLELLD